MGGQLASLVIRSGNAKQRAFFHLLGLLSDSEVSQGAEKEI
jgi:hypothetical protein